MIESKKCLGESGSFVESLGSPVVFLHEINTLPNFSRILSQVDGIQKYDRAIAIARPEDVLLTKVQPEKSYLEWLESVGLGTNKIIVANGSRNETLPERVIKNGTKSIINSYLGSRRKTAVLSPYFGGLKEQKVSRYLDMDMYSRPSIVRKYDSKINFKELCRKLGVPVIKESIFTSKSGKKHSLKSLVEITCQNIGETGKVILRGEYGASASSTYVVDSLTSPLLDDLINESKPGYRYLVEPYYESFSSPSSVWFITKEKKTIHLKTSNQILDAETSHIGNEFPFQFDEELVRGFSHKIAQQFKFEGFIGPFGIDYVETKQGIFAVECNPRVTGAMYPWELVNRIEKYNGNIKAARSENIHMPRNGLNFSDLQQVWGSILYDGHRSTDIILPFNVGPISDGKVTVLCTGTSKKNVSSLLNYAKSSLNRLHRTNKEVSMVYR